MVRVATSSVGVAPATLRTTLPAAVAAAVTAVVRFDDAAKSAHSLGEPRQLPTTKRLQRLQPMQLRDPRRLIAGDGLSSS